MVKSLTNPFLDRPLPLGTLLSTAGQRLAGLLDRELGAAGFTDIRAAHAPVFMSIDPEGSRITELAERAQMTKQAMGELLRHLAERGYVEIGVDPSDRRARRVVLTDRGWSAIEVGVGVIERFDAWLAQTVGERQVAATRRTLGKILREVPAASS